MKKRERKKGDRKGARKDQAAVIGILTILIGLIFRVPLTYIIGAKGIGYFALANECYIVTGCLITTGLSEATASAVRYRIRREQHKSAERVLCSALLLGALSGLLLFLLFFAGSGLLAEKAAGLPLSALAVGMMAPAVFFGILTGIFRGYFQGQGSRLPAVHSRFLEAVFLLAGGLLGAGLMHGYGEKVSALLQNEDYAAAYGAMGAAIGILASSVLCFLHMLLIFFLYRANRKGQEVRDLQKNQDRRGHILHMLIGTALPFSATAFLFQGYTLLDGCLFTSLFRGEGDPAELWGHYYGKYLVIIGVICTLIYMTGTQAVKRIIYSAEREEYRLARDKIRELMHSVMLLVFPSAIFTAVLAENLLTFLYRGNNSQIASCLLWGSVSVIFLVLSGIFSELLLLLHKRKVVLIYQAAAFAVHFVVLMVLLENTQLGLLSVVVAAVVSSFITAAAGFWFVCRTFQYRQNWVTDVAFPAIAAALGGLVMMLLGRGLTPLIGSTFSLLLCLLAGVAIYFLLLWAVIRYMGNRGANR